MFRTRQFVVSMLLISCSAVAGPGDMQAQFSSGEHRVALIELFTSEGCSSCPPADRWLSHLEGDPDLWKNFTPIGFHVDYWDYIGWNDRFAAPEYSERQRRLVAEGGARFVYTPGFFRNGQEWRDWRRAKSIAGDAEFVGTLSAQIDNNTVQLHFNPQGNGDWKLTGHIAVLGMNVETQVRAGENKGKTLRHDFVALGLISVPLDKDAGGYRATTPLPETRLRVRDQAVIAWVSATGSQTPIQSVGGYWPPR